MLTELRLKRLLAGLSGTELAKLSGIERTRLSRAETDHLRLRPDELARVEAALATVRVSVSGELPAGRLPAGRAKSR